MFNKSIVIAALCSAAAAATTGTTATTKPAATGATATTKPAVVTPAKLAAAAKRNAEAGLVLCDQGDSGIWKEADNRLTKLIAAASSAASALALAKTPYDAQAKIVASTLAAKDKHAKDNQKYTDYLTAATKTKDDLAKAAGVTITTAEGSLAKKALLDTEQNKTKAAGALVDKQLLRVEKLVEAKRAQDKEEARWEEKRAASAAMKPAIDTEVTVATAWETKVKETFTTRSFLFQMLGKPISPTAFEADWKDGCAFGPDAASKPCDLTEKLPVKKDTSGGAIEFYWGTCYNNLLQNSSGVNVATNFKCSPHGLDDDAATTGVAKDGLKAVAKANLGVQNDSTSGAVVAATGLFKAYETANYEYSAGTTKLAAALTAYKEWQDMEILAEMFWMGCWTGETGAATTIQGVDHDANCKSTSDSGHYNVWIQYHMETETMAKATVGAAAKRLIFDQSTKNGAGAVSYANLDGANSGKYTTGTWKHISDNQIEVAAEALASIWIQGFVQAALVIEGVNVGPVADKTQRSNTWKSADQAAWDAVNCDNVNFASGSGCKWTDSIMSKAEDAVAAAKLKQTVNTEETAAMVAYKALATAEEVAVNRDLERARALLTTLTGDIAPLARLEFKAQAAYDAAVVKELTKADAKEKLGAASKTVNTVTTAATGAWAAVEAARVAVASVAEQQKFHDERWHWATDVMKPLTTTYNLAVAADVAAKAAVVTAKARLTATADACKVAAFGVAQTAYTDKLAYAAGLKAIQDKVTKDYTTLATFPTTGAGALCNFPKQAADADKPRKVIDDCGGDTLCCGAAQRFLKDGTKLTIETCQKKEATTFTYYPALPTGALVQPTAETWRFSCISAARKLAAAATAALATGYMMA